ncbi:hypothetical protein QJS04_geneDACA007597 [Acorus gramineus]|uniref:Acyl-coenzyme A thioesterase 13 n=1 Tax=Acorus gramineus TaxID=55184 RepID=A0AAV9B4S4_ACOGR|nr:hypothetical protein QJS04_geneDACA007597 [Acorus gramineus]
MEKARESLTLTKGGSESMSRLVVNRHRAGYDPSFFEGFTLKGIRVDRIEPGFLSCTFRVPPRLTDKNGNLSAGAIASLVDEVGGAAVSADGFPTKVSVDMSIAFMGTASVDNELEITSRVLGHKGGYSGTVVLLKNKATGEVIAEGRHSLFGRLLSKI